MYHDPLESLAEEFERDADVLVSRFRDERGAAMQRDNARRVREALAKLGEIGVPYAHAEHTGYSVGGLKNLKLKNVGTRREPKFRLADLPYKPKSAPPARQYMTLKKVSFEAFRPVSERERAVRERGARAS